MALDPGGGGMGMGMGARERERSNNFASTTALLSERTPGAVRTFPRGYRAPPMPTPLNELSECGGGGGGGNNGGGGTSGGGEHKFENESEASDSPSRERQRLLKKLKGDSDDGDSGFDGVDGGGGGGRGFHSSTFQSTLSGFRHCQTDSNQRCVSRFAAQPEPVSDCSLTPTSVCHTNCLH
jgi:hypothetical protein